MEVRISLKGRRDFKIVKGDRIDILDFEMNGVDYKQIRVFNGGFSKSEYIDKSVINWIKEVK